MAARADVVWARPAIASPSRLRREPRDPQRPALFRVRVERWDTSLASGGSEKHHVPPDLAAARTTRDVVVAVLDTGHRAPRHHDLCGGAGIRPDVGATTSSQATPTSAARRSTSPTTATAAADDRRTRATGSPTPTPRAAPQAGCFLNCFADPSSWHGTHVTGCIVAKAGSAASASPASPRREGAAGARPGPLRRLLQRHQRSAIRVGLGRSASTGSPTTPPGAGHQHVARRPNASPGLGAAGDQRLARGRTTVVVAARRRGHSLDRTRPRAASPRTATASCASPTTAPGRSATCSRHPRHLRHDRRPGGVRRRRR